jgi:hypothetical protein
VQPVLGLTITRAWLGGGSAVILELGPLDRVYPRTGNPKAAAAVMVQWSWRVEAARSVAFGSWSGDRKIANGLKSLEGRTLEALEIVGRLPELLVELSGKRWLQSFMTAQGQPEWTVFLPDETWLTAGRGKIVHEIPSAPSTPAA